MHPIDPDDLERIDQEIRSNELKAEAEELTGGEMVSWESEEVIVGVHALAYGSQPGGWTPAHSMN